MIDRESAFKDELLRLYRIGAEHRYAYVAHAQEIDDLCQLYVDDFVPVEKLERYENIEIIKMMMKQMTAVWRLDPPSVGRDAELVVLVSNVKFDGEKMYIKFKRQSPLKMKRFEMQMSKDDLAKKTGYSVETIERCEITLCDMSRQPEELLRRFSMALECEVEELFLKD